MRNIKINAYIMVSSPLWVAASVRSYYRLLSRLIVTFDQSAIGHSGKPIEIEKPLSILKDLDVEGKITFLPGTFSSADRSPVENETAQRRHGLEEASKDCDWVLQLDTDEVLGDMEAFFSSLNAAHADGYGGLHYPARWLYQHLGNDLYLERSSRFWRPAADYPGHVAVRPHAELHVSRQARVNTFRVDFSRTNSDPAQRRDTPVHRTIPIRQAILHYSHIRNEAGRSVKLSNGFDYCTAETGVSADIAWCRQHPYLAVLRNLVTHGRDAYGYPIKGKHLRFSRIAPPCSSVLEELDRCSRSVPSGTAHGATTVGKSGQNSWR